MDQEKKKKCGPRKEKNKEKEKARERPSNPVVDTESLRYVKSGTLSVEGSGRGTTYAMLSCCFWVGWSLISIVYSVYFDERHFSFCSVNSYKFA